jgi:hypothetical protein
MPSDVFMQLLRRSFVERKKEFSQFSVEKLIRRRDKILFKFVTFHDCLFFLLRGGFYEKCKHKALDLPSKLMVRKRCVFYESVSNWGYVASNGIITVE